jgi:hypothetical protein
MLRPDVVAAVAEGRFHVYAVSTVDEGIEFLTGLRAGTRGADGLFPPETAHGHVDRQLAAYAKPCRASSRGGRRMGSPRRWPRCAPRRPTPARVTLLGNIAKVHEATAHRPNDRDAVPFGRDGTPEPLGSRHGWAHPT